MVKFGKMNGFQFESFCSIWFIFPHFNFKTKYGHMLSMKSCFLETGHKKSEFEALWGEGAMGTPL